MASIKWNPKVKLILSDVDETIADVYLPASDKIIVELEKILSMGVKLFLVSGGGLNSICHRVIYKIGKELRRNILVAHCSGSEVWGFDNKGEILDSPFYSVYQETLSEIQRKKWRENINKVISEFGLKIYPTMPVTEFKSVSKADPLAIMYDDRGPQITFEIVNGYDLNETQLKKIGFGVSLSHGFYDMRVPIAQRADELFRESDLPITSRVEAVFAVNFATKGVSKETAIRKILENSDNLNYFDLTQQDIKNPSHLEIWGDKFSELRTKLDSLMCRSVDPKVRAVDFRQENRDEFPKGYNIVFWDGEKHLHEGLLEYLQTR